MAHQSASKADVTMMLRKEAVIATCMTTALTDIRVALLAAEAPRVQAVHHPRKVAVLLPMKRAKVLLQEVRKQIHPAVVLQRRITVLRIPMMMAIMRFMKMMIMTGIVTGAMMTMLPVWTMQWKMRIGNQAWRQSLR